MAAHRFRYFTDRELTMGVRVVLGPADAAHAKVVRHRAGAEVELVDATGAVWCAVIADQAHVEVQQLIAPASVEPGIELIAGMLTGQQWDTLLDGAVQAGVTRIVPCVQTAKDAARADARRARSHRIIDAAARQAKRRMVPELADAIDYATLCKLPSGFICQEHAHDVPSLVDAARSVPAGEPVRLLVGPAAGLDDDLVAQLVGVGWQPVSLGPTVFRSELAAAVAVAMASAAQQPAR